MGLIKHATLDERLLLTPIWVVDTCSLSVPAFMDNMHWHNLVPHDIRDTREKELLTEEYLDEAYEQVRDWADALEAKRSQGRLFIAPQQQSEIVEGRKYFERQLRLEDSDDSKIEQLFREQMRVYEIAAGAYLVELDAVFVRLCEITSAHAKCSNNQRKLRHGSVLGEKDKAVIASWLYLTQTIDAALISRDRGLLMVANRMVCEGIVEDSSPLRMYRRQELIWETPYGKNKKQVLEKQYAA